jgi:hypothetical protein
MISEISKERRKKLEKKIVAGHRPRENAKRKKKTLTCALLLLSFTTSTRTHFQDKFCNWMT